MSAVITLSDLINDTATVLDGVSDYFSVSLGSFSVSLAYTSSAGQKEWHLSTSTTIGTVADYFDDLESCFDNLDGIDFIEDIQNTFGGQNLSIDSLDIVVPDDGQITCDISFSIANSSMTNLALFSSVGLNGAFFEAETDAVKVTCDLHITEASS